MQVQWRASPTQVAFRNARRIQLAVRGPLPQPAVQLPQAIGHHHSTDTAFEPIIRTCMSGIVALAVLCTLPQAASADQTAWAGPARVVDGDTLYIGETKFRLYGVDAPEKTQPCVNDKGDKYACGLVSKDALTQKIGNQSVSCQRRQKDQYGREVAICSLQTLTGSEDLNRWLVQNGLAVAYREYGKDYISAEDEAKAARKGIWAGTFQYPAQWRKEEKAGQPHPPLIGPPGSYIPPPPPKGLNAQPVADVARVIQPTLPDLCGKGVLPIKGNINAKGVKIYHMPGGPYYEKVIVEPEKGEQYFCNEQDAANAGYRGVATGGAAAAAN